MLIVPKPSRQRRVLLLGHQIGTGLFISVILGSITLLFVPLVWRMCWTKGYTVCE